MCTICVKKGAGVKVVGSQANLHWVVEVRLFGCVVEGDAGR